MALNKILEKKYATYYYDSVNSLIEKHWHNENKEMTTEEFKESITQFTKLANKYAIENMLVDARGLYYVVTPEVQKWADKAMNEGILHKLSKMHFVLPKDIFEKISLQFTLKEVKKEGEITKIRHFTSLEEARVQLKR